MITNYRDNRDNTRVKSDVYRWESDKGQFTILPVYYLDTVGAIAVEALHLDEKMFVSVASYLDSVTESHELKYVWLLWYKDILLCKLLKLQLHEL